MDVAIMRTTKPRAMPTILRLIDWLNMGFWVLAAKRKVRVLGVRSGLPQIGRGPLSWTMFERPSPCGRDSAALAIIGRRASLSCTKAGFDLFNNNEARRLA